MADDKKNPLGPTGRQVQANVQRLREARNMTKKDLSERVADLGRPIPPLGISRIEAGTRRVDADDLAVLAVALGVSPGALLLPMGDRHDQEVEITGAGRVPAGDAWLWAYGRWPLGVTPGRELIDLLTFQMLSVPEWLRDPPDQLLKSWGELYGQESQAAELLRSMSDFTERPESAEVNEGEGDDG